MKNTSQIEKAAQLLRAGGLVAFPTETVYGLGADAANEEAIRKIFLAKERPFDHPLIVHVADLNQINQWAQPLSPKALKLAQAFWPGPLTLILKKQPSVLDIVTGGQETIGIRIPRHPIAQALLHTFGSGIAAPSANKFTHVSPTTAEAVFEELGTTIDLILDGGACEVGLESTIVDMSEDSPVILRPGMITKEAISSVLNMPVLSSSPEKTIIKTPGMHHLHYAPHTPTSLIASKDIPLLLQTIQAEELPIAMLTHDQTLLLSSGIHWIKMPKEAEAYAHDLYQTLRSVDHEQVKHIFIEEVPEDMEWEAIRDRLFKASRQR